jgi:hypothetical protein
MSCGIGVGRPKLVRSASQGRCRLRGNYTNLSEVTGLAAEVSTEVNKQMVKKYTARCACGAIKFGFDTDPTFIADCYCKDCQKSSGGVMATFFGVPWDDFTLFSGEPKSFHYLANSGRGLDRNFCPDCGARLFSSNLEGFPGLVFVTIGSLDQPETIEPILEMFTKRRLKWAKPLDVLQFPGMPN